MKKGVILLITIFFISSISILIYKHLEDSEKFIKEVSLDHTLTQLKTTSKNIKSEVIKLINEYADDEDNIDKIVEITSSGIPFDYANIETTITLDRFVVGECNINDINSSQNIMDNCSEDVGNKILNHFEFIETLQKYRKLSNIDTKDKFDYFIKDYKKSARDEEIDSIKEQFDYIKLSDTNSTYLKCDYTISVNNTNASGWFIFKSTEKTPKKEQFLLLD
jgi:hypothetical protein